MPQKTPPPEGLFKLRGRLITQGGVEMLLIVEDVDDGRQARLQLSQIAVRPAIELFGFEGLDEALAIGVVRGRAGAAHADRHLPAFEYLHILLTRVLHTAIGVMHLRRRPVCERQLQRRDH